MDTQISSSNSTKTTVFNLIILDESGSMCGIVDQTLSGCNETLNVIRHNAQKHGDKIRSLVSIYAFQADTEIPSRYLIKNAKPEEVKDITLKDYQPLGSTPLLDAIGSTLSELKTVAATHEDSTGIVTIITDGYENSSRQYTWAQVASIISSLKELGWTINLIGANIDVDQMAKSINIDNKMSFTASADGSQDMFVSFNASVDAFMEDYACEDQSKTMAERIDERKKRSTSFFRN